MRKSKNKQKSESFSQRLVNLISEPDFVRFENILKEPNIFKIVGRTHYERWHSCFLGWLLDSNGTHLLSHRTLVRFLLLLLDDRTLKPSINKNQLLLDILPTIDFSEIQVTPNEYISTETSVKGIGRFDIFLTAHYSDGLNRKGKINLIIELKIDSRPSSKQSSKYANWLDQAHPDGLNLLVYLTPDLHESSKNTVGDERWYCIDYQLLNDKLLEPLLEHPNLNEKVKPFITQYVKNLKIPHKGIKMAITEDEKRMALTLYEKYSDVFDSIYDALMATGTIDYSTSDTKKSKGRISGRIAAKIENKIFSGSILRDLFEQVLRYIVNKGYIGRLPLPWGTSNQRYIITNAREAVHPTGRLFFNPVRYKEYSLETHYARDRGLQVLASLCEKLDLSFEPIET